MTEDNVELRISFLDLDITACVLCMYVCIPGNQLSHPHRFASPSIDFHGNHSLTHIARMLLWPRRSVVCGKARSLLAGTRLGCVLRVLHTAEKEGPVFLSLLISFLFPLRASVKDALTARHGGEWREWRAREGKGEEGGRGLSWLSHVKNFCLGGH